MHDDDNLSELLDDDKLPGEYPPDEPLGALEEELTVRGQQTDEPLEERVEREEPEAWEEPSAEGPVGHLVEPEAGQGPDLTKEAVARAVDRGPDRDDRDAGDVAGDVATERFDDLSAEEAAVYLTEDPPMGEGDP